MVGFSRLACLSTTSAVSHAGQSTNIPCPDWNAGANVSSPDTLRSAGPAFALCGTVVPFFVAVANADKSAARRGACSRADALLGTGVPYAVANRTSARLYPTARHGRPAGP
jgi:hypothetical protein